MQRFEREESLGGKTRFVASEESFGAASEIDPVQEQTDNSHLQMLAVGHLVVGILTALFSSVALIHTTMGFLMIRNPEMFTGQGQESPPAFFGPLFFGVGLAVVLGGWTLGALGILASRNIRQRRGKGLIQAVSMIHCLNVPIGLALGVFTLITLGRPSVSRQFGQI